MSLFNLEFPLRSYKTEAEIERATEAVRAERKRVALQDLIDSPDYLDECIDAHDCDLSETIATLREVVQAVMRRPMTEHTAHMVRRAVSGYLDLLADAEVDRLEIDQPILHDDLPL